MTISKPKSFIWKVLLILIFLRPFISEYAFLSLGFWYISLLIVFSIMYLALDRNITLFSPLLNFSVFLFLITILISLVFSGYTYWTLFELYLFIPNVLIFYIVCKTDSKQQRQLITSIFIAASVISMYAIYQYFFGFRHTLDYVKRTVANPFAEEFLSRKRVFATFISPNILAGYLTMMLFLGIGFITSFPQRKRIFYWICFFVMLVSLLFTKSLGGLLTFAVTSILFIFYTLTTALSFKKINFKKDILIFVFIAFFVLITSVLLWKRVPSFLDIHNPNNSIIQRLYYWKASINMIKDFWITGVGWRKFGLLYQFYKPFPANISHYAHNVFLQIMAELGLLGLLSFSLIVFIFFQKSLKNLKNNIEGQRLKIGLFCAGCAFLFHNLIDLSFYFGQVSFFWWIILGLFV